jgi:hypothetical protein
MAKRGFFCLSFFLKSGNISDRSFHKDHVFHYFVPSPRHKEINLQFRSYKLASRRLSHIFKFNNGRAVTSFYVLLDVLLFIDKCFPGRPGSYISIFGTVSLVTYVGFGSYMPGPTKVTGVHWRTSTVTGDQCNMMDMMEGSVMHSVLPRVSSGLYWIPLNTGINT